MGQNMFSSAAGKSSASLGTFPMARLSGLKATSKTTHVSSSLFRGPKRDLIRHRKPNSLGGESFRGFSRISLGDVVIDQRLERCRQLIVSAFQGHVFLPVDVHRAARRLAGARKANADISGFRFAGAVDDT